MAMIARAMKVTGLKVSLTDNDISRMLKAYDDGIEASEYAEESIATCLKARIVSGKGESKIAPKDYVTRAEVAIMVQRLLQESGLI